MMMIFPFSFWNYNLLDNVDFKFSVGTKNPFHNIIFLHKAGNLSFSWTPLKLIVNITAILDCFAMFL